MTMSSHKDSEGKVRCGDCNAVALSEKRGDELVYMCREHGWVATLADIPER